MANRQSIYGMSLNGKMIYGVDEFVVCDTTDTCLTNELLAAFLDMTVYVKAVVNELFPAAIVSATYVSNMGAIGGIPASYFVRLVWRKRHPGETFFGSPIQIGQIRDIYLEYNLAINPAKDQLFAT